MNKIHILTLAACFAAAPVLASDLSVVMHSVNADGVGDKLGTVSVTQSAYGVVFTPALAGLAPGLHGFHVHEHPSCEALEKDGKKVPALAAGGHYDPKGAKKHGTAWGDGHLGDLPALYVSATGQADYPVLAPRLTLEELKGRSLMVHVGGDNHSDHPAALGGGGARMACGVFR